MVEGRSLLGFDNGKTWHRCSGVFHQPDSVSLLSYYSCLMVECESVVFIYWSLQKESFT